MRLDDDTLYFIPLGGCGEIGMNFNVYIYNRQALLVDCGVMFGEEDETLLCADISALDDLVDRVIALVITHAHQDHIGAIPYLWPELDCPVYGTQFAIEMMYLRLDEMGLSQRVPVRMMGLSETVAIGPFLVRRIPLTHSTIEMGALHIQAGAATVLHTGDWTFDDDPILGPTSDLEALKAMGIDGVDALVGDSTNALKNGWTGAEGSLREAFLRHLSAAEGRVVVTMFSSNVARLKLLSELAQKTGRELLLLGRSLNQVVRAAKRSGYLGDFAQHVSPREFGYIPPRKVLIICSGSQGSWNSTLVQLARDRKRDVYLESGDRVLFSARRIPGREQDITDLQDMLNARGIEVVDSNDDAIHVSGHPCQDEIRHMLKMVQPRVVIPVHGEGAHLEAHGHIAEAQDIRAVSIQNGDVMAIKPAPNLSERVGCVHAGRRRIELTRG